MDVVAIIDGHGSAKGVGGEFFSESLGKWRKVVEKELFEFFWTGKRTAVGELAAGIHRWVLATALSYNFFGSPTSNGIVVVEGQPKGVDVLVTGGTTGMFRVGLEFLANGRFGFIDRIGLNGINIGRRRIRRLPKDGFRDPDTAMHRTMPRPIRTQGKCRRMGQDTSSMIFRPQSHPLKPGFRQVWQTVVQGQPWIHHRPIRIQKLRNGQVLCKDFGKIPCGFQDHALLQPFIVVRIKLGIRWKLPHSIQLQPLTGKGIGKAVDLVSFQHPVELPAKTFWRGQFTRFCSIQQLCIRHGTPEKIRQPGGQFISIEFFPIHMGRTFG